MAETILAFAAARELGNLLGSGILRLCRARRNGITGTNEMLLQILVNKCSALAGIYRVWLP